MDRKPRRAPLSAATARNLNVLNCTATASLREKSADLNVIVMDVVILRKMKKENLLLIPL